MDNRRAFLKKSSLGAMGFGLIKPTLSHPNAQPSVGIITNTLRNEMAADYRQAYRRLAEIGYSFIEGGSIPEGMNAGELLKFIRSLGLSCKATGTSMGKFENGGIDKLLNKAEALGADYIVCYYPWLSSAEDLKMPEVMETARRLNEYGKQISDAGFRFAWHNHDKEFAELGGSTPFDELMKQTDPEYVTVELDWYWVVKGGHDPADLFERYPGRFELAHVKDMNNNRDRGITCVGNGIINFESIFEKSPKAGVKHFIVENERAIDGFACAKGSYTHIQKMLEKTGI